MIRSVVSYLRDDPGDWFNTLMEILFSLLLLSYARLMSINKSQHNNSFDWVAQARAT